MAERQPELGEVIGLYAPQTEGHAPTQIVAAEGQSFQLVQVTEFMRDLPAQLVLVEDQLA